MSRISVHKDGRKALISEHMLDSYLANDWSVDQSGTDAIKITALEVRIRDLEHENANLRQIQMLTQFAPVERRDVDSIPGLLNELGLLARHRELKPWARSAINEIYQRLSHRLKGQR